MTEIFLQTTHLDLQTPQFAASQNQLQFWHHLWEGVSYGMAVLDVLDDGRTFRYAAFNPATIGISPIPIAQLLGRTVTEALPPEMAKRYSQYYRKCVRSQQSISFEERICRNGQETWWLLTVNPLRDGDNCIDRLLVTTIDISPRARLEAQYQQTEVDRQQLEQRLRLTQYAFDRAGNAMFWIQPDASFCHANQTACNMLGYTLDELLSMSVFDVDADFPPSAWSEHWQELKQKGSFTLESRQRDKNGRIYPVEILISYIEFDGKEYNFAQVKDISDRKAAEAALSEYADRQTLLNQLVDRIRNSLDLETVIATTLESIRTFLNVDACVFAWYNSNAEASTWEVVQEAKLEDIPSGLGCYPATLVGPIETFVFQQKVLHIDDVAQYEEPLHREFLKTLNCQSELLLPIYTHSNRIGMIICTNYRQVRPWVESEIGLLQAVSDQLAIAIDQAKLYAESRTKSQELQKTLQELQQAQAQMVQSEKMSSLGQLVAGIAHEINNPVSFIHGNVTHAGEYVRDLLHLLALYQAKYPQPSGEIAEKLEEIDLDFLCQDVHKLLTSMKVGTERICEIVKSLRLFSRLDESEFKPVDIHDGIDSTLTILQSRLKAQSIRLDGQEYQRDEIQVVKNYGNLPEVECFAGQLNQVFMNILANAIDALEERDRTRSLTEQRRHRSTIEIETGMTVDRQIFISIADNGVGIPSPIQEKIFDPFFTTKPVGKGTGMGMAISYQIIAEKHNGKLYCNSSLGESTTFRIEIPVRQIVSRSL